MGLFSRLKKNETSNPFKGVIEYDIKSLFVKSNKIQETSNSTDESIKTDFEVDLNPPLLSTFDTLKITLGMGKVELSKETPTILTFYRKNEQPTFDSIKNVVNKIAKCCNVKDDNWEDVDQMRIESGEWRGRSFFLGPNLVSIELDEKLGLSLCITGYQNYL